MLGHPTRESAFKYFISSKEGKIVNPLCIILPQITGYIKYFENGGKNMSFVIKDDMRREKYNEICNKIKETLALNFTACLFMMKSAIKVSKENLVV